MKKNPKLHPVEISHDCIILNGDSYFLIHHYLYPLIKDSNALIMFQDMRINRVFILTPHHEYLIPIDDEFGCYGLEFKNRDSAISFLETIQKTSFDVQYIYAQVPCHAS